MEFNAKRYEQKLNRRLELFERLYRWMCEDFDGLKDVVYSIESRLHIKHSMAKPIRVAVPYRRQIGPERAARNRCRR